MWRIIKIYINNYTYKICSSLHKKLQWLSIMWHKLYYYNVFIFTISFSFIAKKKNKEKWIFKLGPHFRIYYNCRNLFQVFRWLRLNIYFYAFIDEILIKIIVQNALLKLYCLNHAVTFQLISVLSDTTLIIWIQLFKDFLRKILHWYLFFLYMDILNGNRFLVPYHVVLVTFLKMIFDPLNPIFTQRCYNYINSDNIDLTSKLLDSTF